jgi:hypothetical protein
MSDIRETTNDRFGKYVKERRWVNIVYRKLSGQAEGCHKISIRRTVALIEIPKYSTYTTVDQRRHSV